MAAKPLRCWPGSKTRAAEKERLRKRSLERHRCNVCGRAFYGSLVWDEEASTDAPGGICPTCQESSR